MTEILSAISAIDRVSIAIVSGRSLPDLQRRIAFPAALIASHGLEIETREFSFVHPAAEGMRRELDQASWTCDRRSNPSAPLRLKARR